MDEHLRPKRTDLWRVAHFYDYLKHLTTLSTGSLVLLATFATKSAADGGSRLILRAALGLLLICTILSVVCMLLVLSTRRYVDNQVPHWEETAIAILFALSALVFLIGLLAVGIFAFANF